MLDRKAVFLFLFPMLVWPGSRSEAALPAAGGLLLQFAGGHLFSNLVNLLWDKGSGRPNVDDLDSHLLQLEATLREVD